MNERTKKLYEQATTWALDNYPPPVNTFMWEDLRNEKFAELIVRECKKINSELLGHNTLTDLHNMYKDHFGVEE